MIAFVQHFGLQDAGGGSRILRALLEDAPEPYVSICTKPQGPRELATEREVHLPNRPYFGRIEHSRLKVSLQKMLTMTGLDARFKDGFEERLEAFCREKGVSAIHSIAHALDFWSAFRVAQRLDLPYFVTIHDDPAYNLRNNPELPEALERLGHVWRRANGRAVISEAMGQEYCRRYGIRDYDVITDGLEEPIHGQPRARPGGRCRVYFLGAMHLTFHDNVHALEDALFRLHERGDTGEASMILRGSRMPVDAPRIDFEERPFASEKIVEQDFDDVDVLYLPLPFGDEYSEFRRFSMSTKLVTYLGTGLPILYHGPADAAAAKLLSDYDAGVQVNSLDVGAIIEGIEQVQSRREELARNALLLGREQFRLADQRERFWRLLTSGKPETSEAEVPPQPSYTHSRTV